MIRFFNVKFTYSSHLKCSSNRFAGNLSRFTEFCRKFSSNSTKEASETFYVTTPIFYVNAAPHIGHLYSTVLADVIARWNRLQGKNVLFSTGTDEHGLKIQQAAEQANLKPLEFCDKVSETFRDMFEKTSISYNDIIRTTEPRHRETVEKMWNILLEKGYIYKGQHEGWYSVSDETFFTDQQVEEKNGIHVSKETGNVVKWTTEENYKFKLTEFRQHLLNWIQENPKVLVPQKRQKEILSYLNDASFQDLSVSRSRDRLHWGIPVPNDDNHTIYVWLDALTNYLTVANTHGQYWPANVHIVGKDIIKFHAVYWPAFLMAAGLPLPRQIVAHSHWLRDGGKMSKSKGNVVDPLKLIDTYGIDPVRFYLMRDGHIEDEVEFSFDELGRRYKKDLGDQLGNLLQRCTSKALNPNFQIADWNVVSKRLTSEEEEMMSRVDSLRERMDKHVQNYDIDKALSEWSDILFDLNKYFTDAKPWTCTQDVDRLETILACTLESLRIIGILVQPIMPSKADEMLTRLNATSRTLKDAKVGSRGGRVQLKPTNQVLFARLK